MDMLEQIARLKGMAEMLDFDANDKKDKFLLAMMEALEEMAATVNEIDVDLAELTEEVDEIDHDLGLLEDDVTDLVEDLFGDDECECGCGCGPDCDCGCQDGEECTCGDDCCCGCDCDAIVNCPECGCEIDLDTEEIDFENEPSLVCPGCGAELSFEFDEEE